MNKKDLALIVAIGLSLASAGETEHYPIGYREKIDSLVTSVVQCENPEIVVQVIDSLKEFDAFDYFNDTKKAPVDFKRVKLGPKTTGYRAEVIPEGQGATGWKHAWLF